MTGVTLDAGALIICARRAAQAIATDPGDLLRLDPSASVVKI